VGKAHTQPLSRLENRVKGNVVEEAGGASASEPQQKKLLMGTMLADRGTTDYHNPNTKKPKKRKHANA
jgi:hypothetical protein